MRSPTSPVGVCQINGGKASEAKLGFDSMFSLRDDGMLSHPTAERVRRAMSFDTLSGKSAGIRCQANVGVPLNSRASSFLFTLVFELTEAADPGESQTEEVPAERRGIAKDMDDRSEGSSI